MRSAHIFRSIVTSRFRNPVTLVVAALLISGAKTSATEDTIDLPALAAQSRSAVMLITGFDADAKPLKTGTGFFVSANGLVVTNWHVVEGIASAEAKLENGATYKISGILASSAATDLAVLQATAREVKFLNVSTNDAPKAGTRIAVLGSPLALEGTLTEGIVSALRTDAAGKWIQITAPISPGSSGSPVLDNRGEVLGVATLNSSGPYQNLNFARSAQDLGTLLASITPDTKPQAFANLSSIKRNDLLSEIDYIAARKACDRKDFARALELLNRVKQRFPQNDPRLLILLGLTYQNLSLHEDALKTFRAYVKIEPTDAHGWLGLAAELRHFRAFDDAAEAAMQALNIDSDDLRIWRELGEIYYDEKNFQIAVESLRKATSLDNEDWESWYSLGLALRYDGKIAESDAAFSRASTLQKWRTPPDSTRAKPVSESADGSVVKFDNGVLVFVNDEHIEWDAGGFRWRAYQARLSDVEKVGPATSAVPRIVSPPNNGSSKDRKQ
jgi:tetratricopeptide (TPR) repeat protein